MPDEIETLLGKRFIQRPDVKAEQKRNGAYIPVTDTGKVDGQRVKFKMGDLRAHVAGTKSFGHYLVDKDGNCKLFAYDIDLVKTAGPIPTPEDPELYTATPGGLLPGSPREHFWSDKPLIKKALMMELRTVAEGLAARTSRLLDVPTAILFSGGKGLHVYAFTGTTSAADVRAAALDVLLTSGVFDYKRGHNFFKYVGPAEPGFRNIEIEAFPKQDNLDGKDLGNLMRLPLGRNLKTGAESYFIDPTVPSDEIFPRMDPVVALEKGINWG